MQKTCQACGMPTEGDFCEYCKNEDGSVKSCKEIFEGGVQYFMSKLGNDRTMAEKIVRKNMMKQPYWQDNNCECLKGEVVTDEEFAEVLKKM
jgi:hypothetical protein